MNYLDVVIGVIAGYIVMGIIKAIYRKMQGK